MTSVVKTPEDANDQVPSGRLVRSHMERFGRAVLIFAACILLAGGGYYACLIWSGQGQGNPVNADDTAKGILTAVVTRGDIEDTVTATGVLQPLNYVDVGTQVSGQVKKLWVGIGAIVKAGEILADIDPSVYQSRVDAGHAQLLNQRAQLADRQAQLALAKLQFARQQNLERDNATTTDALQIAEATQHSATAQRNALSAQMQQTRSTLRGDEANLGYTTIYAPMTGTVVLLPVKEGQTLNANQQVPIIMRIADLWAMTVQARVSEVDLPRLHVGMDVYFTTLGGDQRRFYGKLRQIQPTPTVVNNVVLYDALFDVANLGQALKIQMTAHVFFVVSSARDAVLAPLAALRPVAVSGRPAGSLFNGGKALVRVVGSDGKISEREATVGVMNRISAQITAGLEPGEQVVLGTRGAVAPVRVDSSEVPAI